MSMPVYYDRDVDPGVVANRTFAVIGYGSQGCSHALNLRDSGYNVVLGQRPGKSFERARDDGFKPLAVPAAVQSADILILALPDETMGETFAREIAPHLRNGQTLGFIHGFNIRYAQIHPPAGVDAILVAPKGPGSLVRDAFVRGGGVPCFVAVHQDASGTALKTALAWGRGIGGGKGGMILTTFAEECETDLFGEQTILCGGVIELMKAGYEILVEAGYAPEAAYFECIHEVKQIVDLQYAGGLAAMRERISGTAAFGGLTRGPRLITDQTRAEMRQILAEIRDGRFAEEWIDECRSGKNWFRDLARRERAHPSEESGKAVRRLAAASAIAPAS